MNNLVISSKKFITNKNTVTIIGVVVILVILYFLYSSTVSKATQMIEVPVAAKTINPQTQITADDVTYIEVANAAKPDNVLTNENDIVGKYSGVGSTIPEGSMFYNQAVVEKDDLPGSWLTRLEKNSLGELDIPIYISVDTTTTYGNSIQPDMYVDIYVKAVNEKEVLMFGKMLSNIKVLATTDSEGKDVFRSSEDIGSPAFLNFGVSADNFDLLKKAIYLDGKQIELVVVPHGGAEKETGLEVNVSSEYLRDYIQNLTFELPQNAEVTTPETTPGTTPEVTTPVVTPTN